MTQPADVYELLRKIRYDATAIQAKVTDALNALGQLNLPDAEQLECPNCGLRFPGPNTLAEHLHVSHDGPLPEHWARADQLIAHDSQHPPDDEPSP